MRECSAGGGVEERSELIILVRKVFFSLARVRLNGSSIMIIESWLWFAVVQKPALL